MLQKIVLVSALLAAFTATPAAASFSESEIIDTIVRAESSGRPWVIGDHGRARGLMQIQLETWRRFTREPWDHAFHAQTNRLVGALVIRDIARRYGSRATKKLIVYTYNTGRFLRAGKSLPSWTKKHPNRIYRKVFA